MLKAASSMQDSSQPLALAMENHAKADSLWR
jgi:hypothetical protein